MKIVKNIKDKKHKSKRKTVIRPKKEKVLLVAQEIKFGRLLSGNEKKTRDRVLKTLKKWLLNRFENNHEFKEEDFIRVWKGLFYAVWMSDKPLVQEDLCESISSILDQFPPEQIKYAMLMVKAGFKVLATEWYGLDQHRIDKFFMLIRRYLRGAFRCLLRCDWSLAACQAFTEMLTCSDGIWSSQLPHYARNSVSMVLHVMDCYLEELAKVSKGEIPQESMCQLMCPFVSLVCGSDSLCGVSARKVLTSLLRQSSQGLDYEEKARAWKQMGCPVGGPDALVPDDDATDDENDGPQEEWSSALDPRAGHVDVVLSCLPVPASLIARELQRGLAASSSRLHRRAKICMQRFQQLSRDEYPLAIKDVPKDEVDSKKLPKAAASASQLRSFEKRVVKKSDELDLKDLPRKQRKRLMAKARSGESIVQEVKALKKKLKKEKSNASASTPPTSEDRLTKAKKTRLEVKQHKAELKAKLAEKRKPIKPETSKFEKSTTGKKMLETVTPDKKRKPDKPVQEKRKVEKLGNGNVKDKKLRKASVQTQPVASTEKKTKSEKRKSLESAIDPHTPKRVKFELKKNSMQQPLDYYRSVRQSPGVPFDGAKRPSKTNLKPSAPSPINPFCNKRLRLRK